MGTRGLTAVMYGGEYKIAQYGQWDHYPDGQGLTALKFLREQLEADNLAMFRLAVERCCFLSPEDTKRIEPAWREQMKAIEWHGQDYSKYEEYRKEVAASYLRHGSWTHLSGDVGAQILDVVMKRPEEKIWLQNSISFAGDGLFCEWAWVIDLDRGTFEAFEGFKKTPTQPDSRFPSGADWLDKADGYSPVHLVAQWSLDALPTEEEFLATFEREREEDLEDA